MMKVLPFLLLLGAACALAYIKEIDRLDRDEEPSENGRKFFRTAIAALVLTLLFTLWSVDAGLILLTLSLYLSTALAGVYAGQKLAWLIYRKRNPELTDEEECFLTRCIRTGSFSP